MNIEDKFLEKYPNLNKHYLNRYMNLINSGDKKNGKFEKHHILPKSLFPEYSKSSDNIIKSDIRLHFILHWVLVKMLPNSKEMSFAFYSMCNSKKYTNKAKSSKLYKIYRDELSKKTKIRNINNSIEGCNPFNGPEVNLRRMKQNPELFFGPKNPLFIWNQNNEHMSRQMSRNGTHCWQNRDAWDSRFDFTKQSLLTWKIAHIIHKLYKYDGTIKSRVIKDYFEKYFNITVSSKSIQSIQLKFKSGWIPEADTNWLEYKNRQDEFSNVEKSISISDLPSPCRKQPWENLKSTKISLNTWKIADKIYEYYIQDKTQGYYKIITKLDEKYPDLSKKTARNILEKIVFGWVPMQDDKWISFLAEKDLLL